MFWYSNKNIFFLDEMYGNNLKNIYFPFCICPLYVCSYLEMSSSSFHLCSNLCSPFLKLLKLEEDHKGRLCSR